MLNNAKIGSVAHRNDTAEKWAKAVNFIPKKGELIIYNPDPTIEGDKIKFKFGNGIDNVNALPFAIVIDSDLDDKSTNPIQNKVVKEALNTKESSVNKTTVINSTNASSDKYPSEQAVVNYAEAKSNKVDSIASNTANVKYPSVKAVRDYVTGKLDLLMAVMIEGTPTYFKVMKVDESTIPENERLTAQSQ